MLFLLDLVFVLQQRRAEQKILFLKKRSCVLRSPLYAKWTDWAGQFEGSIAQCFRVQQNQVRVLMVVRITRSLSPLCRTDKQTTTFYFVIVLLQRWLLEDGQTATAL